MKHYGQLDLSRPAENALQMWRVSALEPHVAIAFKRLFPRVRHTDTTLYLSDTDEVRADLKWFMQRYPLATDHHYDLADGARRLADRQAERGRILLPDWKPDSAASAAFHDGLAPYGYQSAAASIAIANGALLLGDDVGLGKTISAIATIAQSGELPAAVVVQPHLATQWASQIAKFTGLRTHIIKGRTVYDLPAADIYIFRYSNVSGWVDIFDKGTFRAVVYDEVQELRRGDDTSKGAACRVLSDRAALRMGLTATPIINYGDEMHTVMGYIQPDLLGSRDEFIREWCTYRVVRNPDALGAYLQDTGYFLRRREDDPAVDASMPPANVLDYEVAWDSGAADREIALTRLLAQTVLNGSFVEAGQAARDLDAKMRQLTGIAKARSVAAYVKMLLEDAPRVVLAGWHREVYDIWNEELSAFAPCMYTGSETTAGKNRSVDAFINGKSRVLMMSLRSGAGLDGLQYHCSDVVFGEFDWSPQIHYQLIGRLRRPGQRGQVTAHYLHCTEGSDPVLLETLGIKTDQSRGINDPGRAQPARFTDDSRIRRLAEYVLREMAA